MQRQITAAIAVGSEIEGVLSSIARAAARLCRVSVTTLFDGKGADSDHGW